MRCRLGTGTRYLDRRVAWPKNGIHLVNRDLPELGECCLGPSSTAAAGWLAVIVSRQWLPVWQTVITTYATFSIGELTSEERTGMLWVSMPVGYGLVIGEVRVFHTIRGVTGKRK